MSFDPEEAARRWINDPGRPWVNDDWYPSKTAERRLATLLRQAMAIEKELCIKAVLEWEIAENGAPRPGGPADAIARRGQT